MWIEYVSGETAPELEKSETEQSQYSCNRDIADISGSGFLH